MSLDLSILEIAADIIDETGRGPIAEQVRELKGKVERLVECVRLAEELNRALTKEYPSNLVLAENSPRYGKSEIGKWINLFLDSREQQLKDNRSVLVVNPGDTAE